MKSPMMKLMALLLATVVLGQQRNAVDLEVQLKEAAQKELVEGDLKGAIALYEQIVTTAGSNRAAAAKALVEIGLLYERQRSGEARKVYERVVQEFRDQTNAVTVARSRLKALEVDAAPVTVAMKGRTWLSQSPGLAISRSGRYLFGRTLRDLVTGVERKIEGIDHVRVEGSDNSTLNFRDAWGAAFSADGKLVVYSPAGMEPAEIRTMAVTETNSPSKLIFRNEEFVSSAPFGWSPDSKNIFALLTHKDRTNAIAAISTANGSYQIIKSLEWRWPDRLSLSPDGRYIAYDILLEKDSTNRDIFVLSTDGRANVPLVERPARDAAPVWTPDGNAVVFMSDQSGKTGLWIVVVDEGNPRGNPSLLQDSLGPMYPVGFANDGSLYSVAGSVPCMNVYTAEIDSKAGTVSTEKRIESYADRNFAPMFSPDGKSVAYFSQRGARFMASPWSADTFGHLTIVVRTLGSGEERAIPTVLTNARAGTWLPDGSLLFVGASDADQTAAPEGSTPGILWKFQLGLHRIDLETGKDLMNRFVESSEWGVPRSDGKTIYYFKREDGKKSPFMNDASIMAYDIETGRTTELFRGPGIGIIGGFALSPDGRQIAFVRQAGPQGGVQVMVMPVSGGSPQKIGVLAGLFNPNAGALQWDADGKNILVKHLGFWWVPANGEGPRKIVQGGLGTGLGTVDAAVQRVARDDSGCYNVPQGISGVWADPGVLPNREGHQLFTAEVEPGSGRLRGPATAVAASFVVQDHAPSWLPDGKSVTFIRNQMTSRTDSLIVRSLETSAEEIYPFQTITNVGRSVVGGQGGMTQADGRDQADGFKVASWFHQDGSLLQYRFTPEGGAFLRVNLQRGEATLVARLGFKSGIKMAALSPDDRTLYVANNDPNARSIVAVDVQSGNERNRFTLPKTVDPIVTLALSSDGRHLALRTDKGLFRIGVDGRGLQTLVSGLPDRESAIRRPVWTKDGRAILIAQSERSNFWQILRVPSDGKGKPASVGLKVEDLGTFDLSPDGTRVIFDGVAPKISSAGTR